MPLGCEAGNAEARLRLFHFSDDLSINHFEPRPTRPPKARPEGHDWLNDALVWAIDEAHVPMYLFPREVPRILLWRKEGTTRADADRFFGRSHATTIAYVEARRFGELTRTTLARYELPNSTFIDLNDAGMWVSKESATPLGMMLIDRLDQALLAADVELRVVPSLVPYADVWQTTLHASGIRLGNAVGWPR